MNSNYPILTTHVLIVGYGASALNACDELIINHVHDILIVCPKKDFGISRNTGSDKQTYYKLSTTGNEKDSVYDMANTFVSGKSMHGDIALTLSANSLYTFFKLVNYGLPFPQNEYGEYVGYRTDHDNKKRATSCGPLTSKYMTMALENKVNQTDAKIMEDIFVTSILKDDENNAIGVLAFSDKAITETNKHGAIYIFADEIIWATGGPSTIYKYSVYPESATCSFGFPIIANANCINLTESQYGIASTEFRWNLSGSYQQAIPRYVSIDKDNNEHEFLFDYMKENDVYTNTFKKGYEWPFNPEKTSSRIDLMVYSEILKGNKVYLDYTKNPKGYDVSKLDDETYSFLSSSSAICDTPYERLEKINQRACDLFKNNGYDLSKSYLNISVSAQHLNGGFDIDINGESTNIHHLYFVGECAGTYGVKRPGGSALLAGQVFSMRCARKIASNFYHKDIDSYNAINNNQTLINLIVEGDTSESEINEIINNYQIEFSNCCAFLRNKNKICEFILKLKDYLSNYFSIIKPSTHKAYIKAIELYDILITQYQISKSILSYIDDNGQSRGAYIITSSDIESIVRNEHNISIDFSHDNLVEITNYNSGNISCHFENTRKIPDSEQWFEKVYNK